MRLQLVDEQQLFVLLFQFEELKCFNEDQDGKFSRTPPSLPPHFLPGLASKRGGGVGG